MTDTSGVEHIQSTQTHDLIREFTRSFKHEFDIDGVFITWKVNPKSTPTNEEPRFRFEEIAFSDDSMEVTDVEARLNDSLENHPLDPVLTITTDTVDYVTGKTDTQVLLFPSRN